MPEGDLEEPAFKKKQKCSSWSIFLSVMNEFHLHTQLHVDNSLYCKYILQMISDADS